MHCHPADCTIYINLFKFMQGANKGAPPAAIGVIIGIAPLCTVIVSPFVGYLVCPSSNNPDETENLILSALFCSFLGLVCPAFVGLILVGIAYTSLG